MDLENLKEAADESNNQGNKSDMDAQESEPEISATHIKDHIIKMDNQPFDFVPISQSVIYCWLEHNRTAYFHGHVQILILEQAKRGGTIYSSRILFQVQWRRKWWTLTLIASSLCTEW